MVPVLRAGSVAGIPLRIHPLWFLVVALLTSARAGSYYPDAVPGIAPGAAAALGLATVLGLFGSVVAHELGHALVARRDGVEIEEIDLWPLGGIARVKRLPDTPRGELRMALAGPAVSVALALGLTAVGAGVPRHGALALREALLYLGFLNGVLAVFNLVPALPLDGGRVAHALLWRRTGDRDAATVRAAAAGRYFGWLFVAVGVTSLFAGTAPGPWLAVIGTFVLLAANAEARDAVIHATFAAVPARELMTPQPDVVSEFATVAQAETVFTADRHAALPVVGMNGAVTGLVTLADVAGVPRAGRDGMLVGSITHRDADLCIGTAGDVAELLRRPAFATIGRAVVVDGDGLAVGILSVSDVERELRHRRLLAAAAADG